MTHGVGSTGTRNVPVVSVVMPTYNKGPYLEEAIDSILSQTYSDWELIIVDDGSTDETPALLARYDHPKISVYTLPENVGRSRARNTAVHMARGRYIAICDSDDVSAPTRFERQVSFLDAHPEFGVVSTFMQMISRSAPARIVYRTDPAAIARRFAAGKMAVAHGASMVRAECFERLGFYCEDLPVAEDFELFRRFSLHYRFGILPEVLLDYRRDFGTMSLDVFAKNSLAHRYAAYRSDGGRPEGTTLLTYEEFARRWRTRVAIYTLDLVRLLQFRLRMYAFSRYAVR
jgi:glycosyltransferase involved in cell wall biosynthesis